MESFLKEAISSMNTSGTIKPSSKFLIRDCLKDLDFKDCKTILEFGTGDGCITEEILNNIPTEAQLLSFEVNDQFFEHCSAKFGNHPNLSLINHSAIAFDEILKERSILEVDYIVSSLPLSILKKEDVMELFGKIPVYLKEEGRFVQYQYTLGKYRSLKKFFSSVNIDFTLRNLPPAFIFKCSV